MIELKGNKTGIMIQQLQPKFSLMWHYNLCHWNTKFDTVQINYKRFYLGDINIQVVVIFPRIRDNDRCYLGAATLFCSLIKPTPTYKKNCLCSGWMISSRVAGYNNLSIMSWLIIVENLVLECLRMENIYKRVPFYGR